MSSATPKHFTVFCEPPQVFSDPTCDNYIKPAVIGPITILFYASIIASIVFLILYFVERRAKTKTGNKKKIYLCIALVLIFIATTILAINIF